MKKRVSIIGMGMVGRAWSIAFARAGCSVIGWDPLTEASNATPKVLGQLIAELDKRNLLKIESARDIQERINVADSLELALDGTDWVQESAPEDLETKRNLWKILDELAVPRAILASSTSAIVPSAFSSDLAGAHRCLVAHPLNPPYLIRAVELVPGSKTSTGTMERAKAIMEEIGQAPIVMKRELDGYVMNRLQAAILDEAFHLAGEGGCSVEDVDIGARQELARAALEAVRAGAAIVHLHARDPETGKPDQSPEAFLPILQLVKKRSDCIVNLTPGGAPYMKVEERVRPAALFKPELASLNMGSMNFGLFPMLNRYKDFTFDWERQHLENSRDLIFRNTYQDIDYVLSSCSGNGTRFEFECYDVSHLYNLAHFAERGLVKPPLFVQTDFGLLGAISRHTEDVLHMKRRADRWFGSSHIWSGLGCGC